nr:hypothetical protein [Tanacetum cinerariifolium]
MTGTPFGEFLTGGGNGCSSMGLQLTGNLLLMYTPRGGSSQSPNSRLWNDITISIWIGFRSIVIQRRVEDLQLGVESYPKRLNLTKPDTYRPDLKRREAYTAYSNPRGFIYQNKDKKNRLMRIDELHKFSNGTLNDVRNALDDPWKSSLVDDCMRETFACCKGPYDLSYAAPILIEVEHKNHKKSNEMYHPRFIKVIIHHFMSKDPSIPRRNKVNWHYVRDDHMFSTIKLVSRHLNTQQFGALPKASVRRTRSSSDTSITPPTGAVSLRLTTSAKGKQITKASKAKSLSALSEVPDAPTDESEEELTWNSTDDEGAHNKGKDGDDDEEDESDDGKEGDGDEDDEDDDGKEGNHDDDDQEVVRDGDKDDEKDDEEEGGDDEQEYDDDEYNEETRDEESFDPILKNPENNDDEGNVDEDLGLNIGGEEGHVEGEEEDELYRDVNINQRRGLQMTLEVEELHVTLTPVNADGQEKSSSVSSQFVTSMLNSTLDVDMESIFETTSQIDTQTPTLVAPLPMTAPTMTPSTIAIITTTSQAPILPTTMNEAVKVAVQIQSDRLRDKAQRENDEFLKTIDENMQKIINEQVKEQIIVQVFKILPRIEQTVNEQLEAEVLIEKIKGNKSIQRSDEQRNLYKALVEAYEFDKIILDTYGETVTLKRRRDNDADKDEEPSDGIDRGSKIRKEGKEPESASASASESAFIEEPVQTTCQMEEPSHPEFDTCDEDQPVVQSSPHPEWFSQQQKPPSPDRDWNKTVDTLTLELLAGPTYELMNGSCKSLVELENNLEEVFKATTDQLDWVNLEGASSRKYTTSITKTKAVDYGHINWIEDLQFYGFAVDRESARDVYSKRRIIVVTELKIVEWHSYKHLDWITVRRDDDKLYKFKEGDFKRLRIQDIKDMLLFLVQGKNKDKKNRLMRIDELHKFSDGTLTDVRTALDDHLKGIQMQYLPQSIWRKSDKERAAALIEAIEKRLKTRRIMRSLERFVGGRLYEGDFRMLQRTI